jgi:zinc protease
MKSVIAVLLASAVLFSALAPARAQVEQEAPLEATLPNGLHVIIVANHLAPVVSTSLVYNVGSIDDTIPGIAHATEHMLFRGTTDLSSDQFANIATRMGAEYDASTTATITNYYFTVPARYLDVVLRIEADRMQHAAMREADWNDERGAIEQEVKAHLSNPVLDAMKSIDGVFYGDSPWGKDPVGTIAGFDKMTAADIAAFYHTWYHPNNATLVIAGDVDPATALDAVKTWFGPIAAATVPAHPPLPVAPVQSQALTQSADFPIPLAVVMMRTPGSDAPDYAALQVLFAALNSSQGPLTDLSLSGKSLMSLAMSSGAVGGGLGIFLSVGLPGSDPKQSVADLQGVIDGYAKTGIPDDVIATAKTRLLATQAYEGTSIPSEAAGWAYAQAVSGQTPEQLYTALQAVTPADVNRVFSKYVAGGNRVSLALAADPHAALSGAGMGSGAENVTVTASDEVALPDWTTAYFSAPLQAPHIEPATILHLRNGMTISVQRETSSPTFFVAGEIETNPALYEPKGKDGVASLTAQLLQVGGTTTLDFKAYHSALDAVAASVSLGSSFSAEARAADFDRTIALLADGELHPALPASQFALVSKKTVASLAAFENRPETQAAMAELRALYPPNDPHRRHATSKTMAAVTLDDVKHWYAFAYRPDLATIAVVGDVTPEQVQAAFEKYFGGWTAKGPKPPMDFPPVANRVSGKGSSTTITSTTSKQADVTLTERLSLQRGDRDVVALDLANTMLSGEGTGSMLFHDVRKEHGYVYSIDSSLSVSDSGSTFELTFASDAKNVDAAQSAAISTLDRLRKYAPSDSDLLLAKAMLLANYSVSLDSYGGVAGRLLASARYNAGPDALNRYYARVIATTPQDVQRAMNRWIDPSGFQRVIVAPQSP